MASQLLGEPVYDVNQLGPESRLATLVPVEFPLTSSSETRLRETLERIGNRSSGTDRPLVVLEFISGRSSNQNNEDNAIGRGTSFERALGLARWLSGPKGSRIRSVAYLPNSIRACGASRIRVRGDCDRGDF